MKGIIIHWLDSGSDHGWGKIKDAEIQTGLCVTMGFLVKENAEFYLVCHSWDEENDSVNGTIQIPKIAVKKKRFLKWQDVKEKSKK